MSNAKIFALANQAGVTAIAEGQVDIYKPKKKGFAVEVRYATPKVSKATNYSAVEIGRRRRLIDKFCLGDFNDAKAAVVARPSEDSVVLYGEDNRLLHVTLFDDAGDLLRWKASLGQYVDFTRSIPNTAYLKMGTAWCCDSSEMIYRTRKWLGLSHANRRGVGMAGFVTLVIPPGLVLWPLRQFVLSPADLRGGWAETLKNWFVQVWSPKDSSYTERLTSSGMSAVLNDLYQKAKVNCMSLTPDHFGVLVDPKTPKSENPAAPVVGTVLMALPPPLEDISAKSNVEERNMALGVNLYGVIGELGGVLARMQHEIMTGKEAGDVDAVFRPTSRLRGAMLTMLGVVMVPRMAEAAFMLATGRSAATGSVLSTLGGTTGAYIYWIARNTFLAYMSIKSAIVISKIEAHLMKTPAEDILGK